MPQFVEIAVRVPQAEDVFHYHLPPELEGRVTPGCLVTVPFGAQTVQGVALRRVEIPAVTNTRAVLELVDPLPVVTAAQMALAAWLARENLAPLAACLDVMLPPGLLQHADLLVEPDPSGRAIPADLPALQRRVLDEVHSRRKLRGGQLEAAFPRQNWRAALQSLEKRGLLRATRFLPPPGVRPKYVRTVQLACPPEAIAARLDDIARPGSDAYRRRLEVLRFLQREPWQVELQWVYAHSGGSLADIERLAELGFVAISETEVWRDPLENTTYVAAQPPELTADQRKVWEPLCAGIQAAARGEAQPPYLLHGVTGSGKTEIYLRAVDETLRQGRQAIVLVPEIALTPQTVKRFLGRFPGRVGLVHSRLSPGERYDTWRRARAGLLPVIVGARSALFTPLPDVGLIILDECHEDSYYQSESQPYYHAASAAETLARISGAVVLMGSATPNITQMQRAESGDWRLLSMPVRLLAHRKQVEAQAKDLGISTPAFNAEGEAANLPLPPVTVVDMRDELKAGNRSMFSRPLQDAIGRVLANGQQGIVFLNRRGSATYVFCRDCGSPLHCPRCDKPLTFHSAETALICHTCGYTRKMPKTCPTCGSVQIRQFGAGTEKVEAELQKMFPNARILRWDAETTRQKGAHEMILGHFAARRADLLVGTQMLAKGLDLPLVTLVGVVLAETALNLPDYRAGERTFQVLTQVAGRAGRSPLGGEVILQTFQPQHYVIRAAAGHDYAAFYRQELAYRRTIGYPPFVRLAGLEYRHTDPLVAEQAARDLAERLRAWLLEDQRRATELHGPVPCFFSRVNGQFRWQITLTGPDPAGVLRGRLRERVLDGWRIEIDPPDLL